MTVNIQVIVIIIEEEYAITATTDIEDPLPEYKVQFLATMNSYGPLRTIWQVLTDGEDYWVRVSSFPNKELLYLMRVNEHYAVNGDVAPSDILPEHKTAIQEAIRNLVK